MLPLLMGSVEWRGYAEKQKNDSLSAVSWNDSSCRRFFVVYYPVTNMAYYTVNLTSDSYFGDFTVVKGTSLVEKIEKRFNMAKKTTKKQKSLEETLWDSANKLRGSVEPSEYKSMWS